jgi:hypothetical protein
MPFDELLSAERDPRLRIGPCRAIRLTSGAAGSLLRARARWQRSWSAYRMGSPLCRSNSRPKGRVSFGS